jgi:hypothetical protein
MARRASCSDAEVGQLSLWAEEIVPSPAQGDELRVNESVPSPSQGEGQDGGSAAAHHDVSTPTPTLPLPGGGRPSFSRESRKAVTSPSPSQGEGQDGGAAVAPNERPTRASPPKSKPLRAVAAARKDSIARSERALAAIRSILASESREEAARHAAAFRRNR